MVVGVISCSCVGGNWSHKGNDILIQLVYKKWRDVVDVNSDGDDADNDYYIVQGGEQPLSDMSFWMGKRSRRWVNHFVAENLGINNCAI